MQRKSFDQSEVLEAFFDSAFRDGLLDKKSELIYPDFDISAPVAHEIESIVATASADNRLYGVTKGTGEDLLNEAHPGGGTVTELDNNAPKDKSAAKVETLIERHKAMLEVALGKPTGKIAAAVEKLTALANLMDERGEHTLAAEIDQELAKLAEAMSPAELTGQSLKENPLISNIQGAAGSAENPDILALNEQEAAAREAAQRQIAEKTSHAEKVKRNNSKVIAKLNAMRAAEGLPALVVAPELGIISSEAKEYMTSKVGESYKTWGELFSLLDKAMPGPKPTDVTPKLEEAMVDAAKARGATVPEEAHLQKAVPFMKPNS